MKLPWLKSYAVTEMVRPVASRLGTNAAAFATALGLAGEHEKALAAAVTWALMLAAESAFSVSARHRLVRTAKTAWGKN